MNRTTDPLRQSVSLAYFVAVISMAACVTTSARAVAATIRVPDQQPTIQAGVDMAESGDTVLVAPATYRERIRLKPGVTLRSAGNDDPGQIGPPTGGGDDH